MNNLRRSILLSVPMLALAAGAGAQVSTSPPLTLARCAALAADHSPVAAAALQEERAAESAGRLAQDVFHPLVQLTATPGYSNGLPTAIAGSVPALAGVAIQENLYNPSAASSVKETLAHAALAASSTGQARQEAVRQALVLYAAVYADQELVRADRGREEAADKIEHDTETLVQEGRLLPVEADRARYEAARARQERLAQETDLRLDQSELAAAIGWPAAETLTLAEDPFESFSVTGSDNDLALAEGNDPQLQSLERAADNLQKSVEIFRHRIPATVVAEAQYARLARFNNYADYYRRFKADDWSVGVSVAVPLWSGGRRSDEAARLAAELDRLRQEKRARLDDLKLAVARAGGAVETDVSRAALASQAQALADEDLAVAQALAAQGRGEPEGVATKKIASSRARQETIGAELDLFRARLTLAALRGPLLAGGAPAW